MKLMVGISRTEDLTHPERKRSKDDCRCFVEAFLTRFFEYSEHFVSINVREDDEDVVDSPSGRQARTANQADVYGVQFELHPDIIDDITLVCAGDVQNVICGTFRALLNDEDISAFRNRFTFIRTGATREEREQILARAASSKSPYDYVEARIYRSLRREDFVDPDAGQHEVTAESLLDAIADDAPETDMPDSDEEYFK